MNALYPPVAERADHRCEYCHAPEVVFNFPFEIDHIYPQARGGSDDLTNLALACHACNLFKSDYEGDRKKTNLFHPRRDTWEQHFRAEPDNARILGITPIGRATVARLKMNRPQQIAARRRWILLSLFP